MDTEIKNFEIIDTHVHLIIPSKMNYLWKNNWPENHIEKSESVYLEDHKHLNIKAILFMEVAPCENYTDEAIYFEKESEDNNSKIKGIIAHIPMDESLEFIKEYISKITHPKLIGFRYMIHLKDNEDINFPYYLKNDFFAKLNYLSELKLPFHVSAYQQQLNSIYIMAQKNPKTTFFIEDLGKPSVGEDNFDLWGNGIKQLSSLSNVYFKLSPGIVYPNHILEKTEPYVDFAIDSFGPDRLLVASDWGITNIKFEEWINLISAAFKRKKLSDEQINNIMSRNAVKIYNLNV